MFICGSPHLGRSACLPLSLDRRIGVYVCVCVAMTALLSFFCSLSLTFSCSSPLLYFFDSYALTSAQFIHVYSRLRQLRLTQPHLLWSIAAVWTVRCLTLSSPTQAFVLCHDSLSESNPWFTNQAGVQHALGNPTHNSAMVTGRMKTSASWQQINGSLSPQISRTLNKIWHNSIILKQALSEHTVSSQTQERKVLQRGRLAGCWKFSLSLSTFWILFWSFVWIHFEHSLHLKSLPHWIVQYSLCTRLKRGSYLF